jgi:aspartyl-tRNA(Asn)/glutamyl-tRNA(Gln) amidotransferase subunit C
MKIDRTVVEYVARLARLRFDDNEIGVYTEQLDRILAYMDKLNTLDTTGIEPTSHVIPLTNVFREDVVDFNFGVEESVGNAPEREGSSFRVPPVIEVE